MSCLYKSEIIHLPETKNSMGGTELMRERILSLVDKNLLSQVAIHFSRPRQLYDDVKNILYCHDLPLDPEMDILEDKDFVSKIDKFVFVSYNQLQNYNTFRKIPYSRSVVIPNGIISPNDKEIQSNFSRQYHKDEPIRLIYHTTPHRGLEILVPVFEKLSEEFNIELDVFSSFRIYGWDERDKEYSRLFERMAEIPGIRNHGFVSNDKIIKSLKKSDIFAYPCIWPETSCLALIEAISYGNICVHPGIYALPETSIGLSEIYDFDEEKTNHASNFYVKLYQVLSKFEEYKESGVISSVVKNTAFYAKCKYDFNRIKEKWNRLLGDLIDD